MVIIAIISAAILGTASAAMEAGRRSRTRSTITKLNTLLMERWDSYANRRIDISPDILAAVEQQVKSGLSSSLRGKMLADLRLLALRELMKYEMPDRWSDIVNQSTESRVAVQNAPDVLASIPALSRTYFRRLQLAQSSTDNDMDVVNDNHQAECLYMTIMFGTGEGEARTMFTSQDIGDTDGDGAPEFLDGWGHPIRWLRWAPGFVTRSQVMTGDAEADHDPFDVARRDSTTVLPQAPPKPQSYPGRCSFHVQEMRKRNQRALNENNPRLTAFRIVPLIYSPGPDEEAGVIIGTVDDLDAAVGLDPYAPNPDNLQLGEPDPDSNVWRDNIHNHLIEY